MKRTDLLSPVVPSWSTLAAPERPEEVTSVEAVEDTEAGSTETRADGTITVGLGTRSRAHLEQAGAAVGRATRGSTTVSHRLPALAEDEVATYVEAVTLARWQSPTWTATGPTSPVRPAAHHLPGAISETVERALLRARAALLARNLAITPSNVKTPAWMARRAVTVARRADLDATIWNERMLSASGFGGLLAVGGGSANPPRLVRLDYRPPGTSRKAPPVVIVGKGITFDTGGVNLKPVEGMLAMKTDMLGSAVALAVASVCRELDVRVPVTVLLPLAENSLSGTAYRPSDVVAIHGGRTVEIGNTDAEGRIVLADALAYAVAELAPREVIDIATLTGAARIALGRVAAPVFGTDPALVADLIAAGELTGETLWQLPLPTAYRANLTSSVADIAQVAHGGLAGSIHAALFLREFVGDVPWAHLDIAGPGRSEADSGILAKGGTGFGTRLLLRYLEGRTP